MKSGNYSHVIRIIFGIIVFSALGYLGKILLTPESFNNKYGHFRADAIEDEAAREVRHWTNASCLSCHAYEAKIHLQGRHKTISCEFCHGPYADHIKDGKKTGVLPVKKGEDIKILCMRCHNRAIQARPGEVIKTVVMPDHLKTQKVKETHLCNQCHHVHAPLKYIERAREITGFETKEAI